jgi:hypothetical protein
MYECNTPIGGHLSHRMIDFNRQQRGSRLHVGHGGRMLPSTGLTEEIHRAQQMNVDAK